MRGLVLTKQMEYRLGFSRLKQPSQWHASIYFPFDFTGSGQQHVRTEKLVLKNLDSKTI